MQGSSQLIRIRISELSNSSNLMTVSVSLNGQLEFRIFLHLKNVSFYFLFFYITNINLSRYALFFNIKISSGLQKGDKQLIRLWEELVCLQEPGRLHSQGMGLRRRPGLQRWQRRVRRDLWSCRWLFRGAVQVFQRGLHPCSSQVFRWC